MASDPGFADQVRANPGGVLAGYELTDTERGMLAALGGEPGGGGDS